MTQATVRIGTSGYSFGDWIGSFYPHYIQRGKMLDYYVQHFPTVEINSTYYRIPHPAVMANLAKKAPAGFDFMVKVPQSFTHRRKDLDADIVSFREALKPMDDAHVLSGLLAQFPYSFKFSPESLEYVVALADAVTPHALYAEFRQDSWVNRDVYDRLKARDIGYVCVDEPPLPGLLKPDAFATTDVGYVRLHGRNAEHWWGSGGERYNYLYSDAELEEWKAKIEKLSNKVKALYVFFNNCYDGKAAKNAMEFMKKIGASE